MPSLGKPLMLIPLALKLHTALSIQFNSIQAHSMDGSTLPVGEAPATSHPSSTSNGALYVSAQDLAEGPLQDQYNSQLYEAQPHVQPISAGCSMLSWDFCITG